MSKIEINVLFKKMQKDDKKEVLQFQVQGDELPNAQELVELAGGIVVLGVDGCDAGEFSAEFAQLQRDSKKTTLKFNVKGDSEDKVIKLYPFAGTNVTLVMQPSQMSIEEFYEEPAESLEYNVNGDGTVEVDRDQLTIDEVATPDDTKITDLEAERQKRAAGDDDELPF